MPEGVQSHILASLCLERIPKGSMFLFQGPSGSGKTVMTDNLLAEHLMKDMNAVKLTVTRSLENIRECLMQLGWQGSERLFIIDGYSWLTGGGVSESKYSLSGLSNLSDISIMVSKLLSVVGENSLFIFDHVSTLLSYNDENQVIKLLQMLTARIREAHDWAIIIFESDIHNQSFYNTVRFLMDCVVDFKIEEIEGGLYRSIRIQRARFPYSDSRWHPIEIMSNGKIVIQPSIINLGKDGRTTILGRGAEMSDEKSSR
jgi:KaiC/GvpD/RAD55 family RecA-like ATPase